ncbi:ArsR/SmtB family transcription factor [Thalassotalea maritima]|uniref:ArsR/SmtB family transcription factor n=1 Tax=Thalassotalea maritima TaxID=3242416 RepID=UPI003528BBB6
MLDVANFEQQVNQAALLLKTMGNETRLQILCNLIEQKRTVTQLNERINISQSALSQHLAKLRADNFVTTEKDGLHVYYTVSMPVVAKILAVLQDEFCPQ